MVNWLLIFVACISAVLVLGVVLYILITYMHPEDRNQAWIPKIIVIISMWLAIVTVLLFPLDVANKRACSANLSPSACSVTLPMQTIWFATFLGGLGLAFVVLPFTLFFYEADSDYTFFQKCKSAFAYTSVLMVMVGLLIGILYGLFGYVVYPTQELVSGVRDVSLLQNLTAITTNCIKPLTSSTVNPSTVADMQCTATSLPGAPAKFVMSNWKLRVSLPMYIMAIQSVLGWLVFLVFAGVGMLATPIDWLQQFLGRPKTVITKSEYMQRARIVAQRAKELNNIINMMRRQTRDRRWRSNLNRISKEVTLLEEDEYALERIYPQGEDGDVRWVLFMLGFWVTGAMSVVGFVLSLMWIAQIIVYMVPPTPLHPLLNDLFIVLDSVFPLFGVLFFALFAMYLLVAAMKGNFMLGLNFMVVKLYPMRVGATMMSSFLVNTSLILIMAPAIIQFCAQAFAVYANNTAVFDVFGNQLLYLMGLRFLYNYNVFLYILLALIVLSGFFLAFRGKQVWKKRNPYAAYSEIS